MYTLYHHPLCPFSRKVRVVLSEKKVDYKLVVQTFWKHTADFRRMNPMLTVPFIVDEFGRTIVGSQVIVEYFNDLLEDDNKLLVDDPFDCAEIRRMILWFDEKCFYDSTRHILFEKVFRFFQSGANPRQKMLNAARSNLVYHMKYLGFILRRRNFVTGKNVTIADFAIAAHLSSLDYLGEINWSMYQIVKDWYSVIKSRPSFRGILADRISGFKPSPSYAELDF